jgi:hypothetical protein
MSSEPDSGVLICLLLVAALFVLKFLGPAQYDPNAPRIEAAIDLLADVRRRVLLRDPEAFEGAH